MAEYWIISVPNGKAPQQAWDRLNKATNGQDGTSTLSHNYKYPIPELKVGTLDSLMGLSNDLAKLDVYAESVCKKVASYMGDVLEDKRGGLSTILKVGDMTLVSYLQHFQWNAAKYPVKQQLQNLCDIFSKVFTQIETDLRVKSQAYNNLKTNLQSMERKASGSLLLRNLSQVVKREDFIHDSEYLQTLLVAVPLHLSDDWEKKYERLADYIAPRSARMIYQDDEYGLWAVTIFKKVIEEFKYNCNRNKFFVRDFEYKEEKMDSDKDQINKLISDKKRMLAPLLRWLKVNFSESFSAWVHVKALLVFVESVLRYGLPVNFQAVVLEPQKKQQKKLRNVLNMLYHDLDRTGLTDSAEDDSMPGLSLGMQEYFPYVYFRMILDFESRQ